MPRLPILSVAKIIKALAKLGYSVVRQRGSHFRLTHLSRPPITIPNYQSIDRSLLRMILNQAQLSVEEFLKLLK